MTGEEPQMGGGLWGGEWVYNGKKRGCTERFMFRLFAIAH